MEKEFTYLEWERRQIENILTFGAAPICDPLIELGSPVRAVSFPGRALLPFGATPAIRVLWQGPSATSVQGFQFLFN